MSLTKWEIEADGFTKRLTLTFDRVIKVSTDQVRDNFTVRIDMAGGEFSETEQKLVKNRLNA